jgi:hypothetical protein
MLGKIKYLGGTSRIMLGVGVVMFIAVPVALAIKAPPPKAQHHITLHFDSNGAFKRLGGDYDIPVYINPNNPAAGEVRPTIKQSWPEYFPKLDLGQMHVFTVVIDVCNMQDPTVCYADKQVKEATDFVIWRSIGADPKDPCFPTIGGQICFP